MTAAPAAPPCRITRWAFAYRPDEGKPAAALRSLLRIFLIMVHEFSGSSISLRASALTFSVVLSMVPLLAMSTAILKGLGNGNQMRIAAYRLIDQLDPDAAAKAAQQQEQQDESAENLAEPAEPEPVSLNRHLHNAVDSIFDYVENTNFAALGAFGIVGLLVVVITVLNAVEDAMNAIWHTRRGRSAFRKLMDYLALLVLLPISVNIALAAEAVLTSQKIMTHIAVAIPSAWTVGLLLKLLPFLFITLSLMMMYLFFPSVKVRTGAALCGALFGAVFWFIVQRLYVMLQMGVANYNAIYGSFATVPLFLVWMQLGWMFILLGAVLAYAIQNRNHYRLPGAESTARQRLQQAFDVLLTVYSNFSRAEATGEEELAAVCAVRNEADLSQTVDLLISGGLLHETEQNGAAAYIPSRPADQLNAAQVVRLVFGRGSEKESEGGRLAAQVVQAAEEAVPPEDFPARSSAVETTSI
ncbi:YihY/virulence factor BrkB family protein [Candidatus Electronema sp. JC]|uniref:YihY/virulence factor BrkB family protein n=1 Tax=Candidatus Electronema sp. JC TaxID=3401570 RepID=UPI003B43427F